MLHNFITTHTYYEVEKEKKKYKSGGKKEEERTQVKCQALAMYASCR